MENRLSTAGGMSHNLHLLRFIAAVLVIMSHSFVLSNGSFEKEWFYKVSGGQITMGAFAVGVFFLYSGFLIMSSLDKKPKCKEFIVGRCVRIFPVLICVVFITFVFIGPVMTNISVKQYFSDIGAYKYLLNSIFVLVHGLPGVFENNIYTSTVNGALWTLPVEFLCYIICYIGFRIGILQKKWAYLTIPVIGIGTFGTFVVANKLQSEMLLTVLFPILCFYVGVMYAIYRQFVKLDFRLFLLSLVIFVLCGFWGILKVGFIIGFTYSLIYIAFGARSVKNIIWKSGNWSYAMYLIGFPIQQVIIDIYGGDMNPYINIVIALPIIVVCSIILYEMIEKRSTQYYKKRKENKV